MRRPSHPAVPAGGRIARGNCAPADAELYRCLAVPAFAAALVPNARPSAS